MKNILIIFPNAYDRTYLTSANYPNFKFLHENEPGGDYDVVSYIDELVDKYKNENLSAAVSTHDYPGIVIAEALNFHFNLGAANLESCIMLQNKVRFRQFEQQTLPKLSPAFAAIDSKLNIKGITNFPAFIKPVKGVFSHFTQQCFSHEDVKEFTKKNLSKVKQYLKRFKALEKRYIGQTDDNIFILEEVLTGKLITVDGYVESNKAHIIGIVDSNLYPESRAFQSFSYPSKLSQSVQKRAEKYAKVLMEESKLGQGMFNIEMFYDESRDKLSVLEVNPRMFFAAADFYKKVDGSDIYKMYLNLVTNAPVSNLKNEGVHQVAATFTPRKFRDFKITKVPSEAKIKELEKKYDAVIDLTYEKGDSLSKYQPQSGSYKYAIITLGAESWQALDENYQQLLTEIGIEFENVSP